MMKHLRNIFYMSLATFVLIYAGLYYVDRYILSPETVRISSIVNNERSPAVAHHVSISAGAYAMSYSYDATHIAFIEQNKLRITNTINGITDNACSEYSISYFKWLPDRNRLLAVDHVRKNFKLLYYDADRKESGIICDISAFDSTAEIKDIKVSTLTNNIYIKVVDSYKNTRIYNLTIMKKIKRISTRTARIGNIAVISHENKLAYEDIIHDKVYLTGMKKPIAFGEKSKNWLLGSDDLDRLYIGEMKSGKISKVYFGSAEAPVAEWHVVSMNALIDLDKIIIAKSGQIYVEKDDVHKLVDARTMQNIKYPGEFMQLIDQGIISLKQGKLVLTKWKN